jgi:hypothetical protein
MTDPTLRNIEDIYELSSMQQGLLFETLVAPASGVYVTQMCFTLNQTLEPDLWQQAWQQVVERHPVLRTLFVWAGRSRPLQVVRKAVALPWTMLDWRGTAAGKEELTRWLAADRRQGFPLDQAPLMRCTLIRASAENWYFIWSHHHLLLDGWSLPLILQEVFTWYEAACAGQTLTLPAPRPYSAYIAWLQRQNKEKAEAFWRKDLQGFTTPTPLGVDKPNRMHEGVASSHAEFVLTLDDTLGSLWRHRCRTPARAGGGRGDGGLVHQHLAGARAGSTRKQTDSLVANPAPTTGRTPGICLYSPGRCSRLE